MQREVHTAVTCHLDNPESVVRRPRNDAPRSRLFAVNNESPSLRDECNRKGGCEGTMKVSDESETSRLAAAELRQDFSPAMIH